MVRPTGRASLRLGNRGFAGLCLAAALAIGVSLPPNLAAAQTADPDPDTNAVDQMAHWVMAAHDNQDLPFVIVDKVGATVFVYGPDGQLRGAAPALLGLTRGDDSAPGVGDKDLSAITPDERTTPAGRFVAGYGPARGGETVLWVDFATAISMHPVVTSNPREHRLQRLESPSVDDNRISYGCINLPADFYDTVVRPAFTGTRGIVYILPETRTLAETFPGFAASQAHLAQSGSPDPIAGLLANHAFAP